MCGIAGILTNKVSSNLQLEAVRKMNNAMEHRGPNGSGVFSDSRCHFGHVRLAVMDTSEDAAQPMTLDGVTLVYNGELYNFREKRKELQGQGVVFRGHSDTEVLLQLYLRYGTSCLDHLRGMYAFAIWDSRKNKLFCARDPLGIKPFLYSEDVNGIVFASELKALLASGLVSRNVDRQSVRLLLERGSVPQPATILQNVKWLLPGHKLEMIFGETAIVEPFRAISDFLSKSANENWQETVDRGRDILGRVIERQLVAEVPVGAFLSGGIDSSLLVALMARQHGKVKTFSVGFDQGLRTDTEDETAEAALVAKHLGVAHTRVIVHEKDFLEDLSSIAKGLDHPTVDGVNSWCVSKAASKDLTVAISGTGGDELFAGYPWFGAMKMYSERSLVGHLGSMVRAETFGRVYDRQYRIFDPLTASNLCVGTSVANARPDPLADADVFTRVSGMLLCGYTRDQLLADIDTASMSHGLEVRVPLLDEELLQFALSLPMSSKVGPMNPSAPRGSYAASGVKRILMEIGSPLLPEGFAYRSKKGFGLPMDSWLRGGLRPVMNELLSVETVLKRGFFDFRASQEILKGFIEGRVHWTRPWLLMATELWAREILDVQ